MKKVKVLGKMIPVFVLVLLGIGMVSGALSLYISNSVQADVTVSHPIVQEIRLTNSGYGLGPITLVDSEGGSIQGGESATLWTRTTNLANTPITGIVNNIVTNPGITCGDFEKIEARTYTGGVWYPIGGGYYDITGLCGNKEYSWVQIGYGPSAVSGTSTEITWAAGQVDETEIVVTFKPNVLGTYTFTSEVVPVTV